LEVAIAHTKNDLAKAKKRLKDAQSNIPYNVQDELDAHQEVEGLATALSFAEKILSERF
jgi:hypothetical protein